MKLKVAQENALNQLKLAASFLPAAELQPATWRLAGSWGQQNSREGGAKGTVQGRDLSFLVPEEKLLGCHHSEGHYLSEVIGIVERQRRWIVSIAMHLRPSSRGASVNF